MSFLSPLWLIGLLPWAALAIWLLRGHGPASEVPFINLWRDHDAPRSSPTMRIPPIAVLLMLLAMLLAILAAGRPRISSFGGGARHSITMIVDRGISMSATDKNGHRRYAVAAEMAAGEISDTAVEVRSVPDAEIGNRNWLDEIRALPPTGMDDPQAVKLAALLALDGDQRLVILLSDRRLDIDDPNLVQIAPESSFTNVGIARFALTDGPHPQVMVTILNQSDQPNAKLRIIAGQQTTEQDLELPPRDQSKNYFVDLASTAPVIRAELMAQDDLDLNHSAWLARRSAWPKIEPRSPLGPELNRMIDVFSRNRPASAQSQTVAVLRADSPLPDVPAAIIAGDAGAISVKPTDSIQISDSPVNAGVDWASILSGATYISAPSDGWTPLVRVNDASVIAVHLQFPRRVWVGVRSESFAHKPDFVIFWSNVFNWLGEGGEIYSSQSPGHLDEHWQRMEPAGNSLPKSDTGLTAGLYQTDNGRIATVNAPCPKVDPMFEPQWKSKLDREIESDSPRPLERPLLLGAVLLICAGAVVWPRGKNRAVSTRG